VARRYGVSTNTVRSWLQRYPAFPRPFGRGPQRQYLWRALDLEAYDRAQAEGEAGGGAG
jgi:hypothetical protein